MNKFKRLDKGSRHCLQACFLRLFLTLGLFLSLGIISAKIYGYSEPEVTEITEIIEINHSDIYDSDSSQNLSSGKLFLSITQYGIDLEFLNNLKDLEIINKVEYQEKKARLDKLLLIELEKYASCVACQKQNMIQRALDKFYSERHLIKVSEASENEVTSLAKDFLEQN